MTADATAKGAWWNWSWHPLLFAVFPVLSLFNVNLSEVPAGEVVRPLLVMLIGAVLFWGLMTLALRSVHKAALFSTFTLLLFFLYGNIRGLLRQSAIPLLADCGRDDAFLLRPLLGVLLLVFILLLGTKRSLRGWTGPLNAAGAFLVLWPLFGVGKTAIPQLFKPAPAPASAPSAAKTALPPEQLPDIYYIILDGYAREDTLKRVFKYDNRPFLSRLEEKGFYVAPKSRANYSTTEVSLASSLNMEYTDTLLPRIGLAQSLAPRGLIGRNAITRELRRHGYSIVSLSSEVGLELEDADRPITFPESDEWTLTDFEWLLISLTPLDALPLARASHQNLYELHRRQILYQFEQLPRAADGAGPTFVFAHILCPHPPFVLHLKAGEDPKRDYDTRDGNYYQGVGGTLDEYLTQYPAQVDRLNELLIKTVNRLLEKARRPTVIVLQSDHGSGAYSNWDQPELSDYQERVPNLCAIYTPGGPIPGLYPSITPVNIFRLLFNHYLKTDYPLLPDKSYFSSPVRPLELHPVPDHIR